MNVFKELAFGRRSIKKFEDKDIPIEEPVYQKMQNSSA